MPAMVSTMPFSPSSRNILQGIVFVWSLMANVSIVLPFFCFVVSRVSISPFIVT